MNDAFGLLFLLGSISWLWHSSRNAHEQVLRVVRQVCEKIDVQLLDDSIALHRLRPAFIRQGPSIRRVYSFEFSSDGVDRCAGKLSLIGMHLEWIRIEHPSGAYFVDTSTDGTI